jgi:multicomponent Na+:H+ antiporter subunit C
MIGLVLAVMVGMLFATGTYLMLRRDPVKLLLGLGLLSYGTNLLIFGSGSLKRGAPPIVADKANFNSEIGRFVDPLPQALILTAIVISFGVTAFMVVLVNRRNTLNQEVKKANKDDSDPFAISGHYLSGLDEELDDYEWLEYSWAEERQRERREQAIHENEGLT